MVKSNKGFWINLCFFNLVIVAILGFVLRSKIIFSIPFLDFKNLLNAHSHYAFSGWVGLCIITLFVYDLLPAQLSAKKIYQWILIVVQVSSVGMLISFPIQGYAAVSIAFSTLFIVATYVFAWVFIKDIFRSRADLIIKMLSIGAIICLVVSSIGPFGLAYIVVSKSGNHVLYRDLIYTFLHFQYNGFFTLSVMALISKFLIDKGIVLTKAMKRFAVLLCLSVVPSLFLSLLWHNNNLYFILAAVACVFIVLCVVYFIQFFYSIFQKKIFKYAIAYWLCLFSLVSFLFKMVLMVGTIFPVVGHAVFGDRPIIIGFLHLVFLGFVTLYFFAHLIETGFFTVGEKIIRLPFVVFTVGIFANEILLMLQGLGILFKVNSFLYSWLLWVVAIILVVGALLIFVSRLLVDSTNMRK